jgi:hypothetical protein
MINVTISVVEGTMFTKAHIPCINFNAAKSGEEMQ